MYAMGGIAANGPSKTVERYCPNENTWEHYADMPQPLSGYEILLH